MDPAEEYSQPTKKFGKAHNVLPLYGNENSMNLNPLILANIQGSSYFKVHLFKLKTYHEVVDEIYYQVKHLEPWERGSRKTSGQTGMCGGVRGVGAGGIVSTAFCLLYKLYTLRLTRKQVNGLMAHTDSPYIRALGFMYVRYTQPPGDLFDWYEEYLQDEEEIDVKAGGGQVISIGQMLYQWLTKLDWFSTLFPRIPVPIQKQIERKLADYCRNYNVNLAARYSTVANNSVAAAAAAAGINDRPNDRNDYRKDERRSFGASGGGGVSGDRLRDRDKDYERRSRSRERKQRRDERYADERYADGPSGNAAQQTTRAYETREGRRSSERYDGQLHRRSRSRERLSRESSSHRHKHKKDHHRNYYRDERDEYNRNSTSGYRSRSHDRDRKYR